MADIAKRCGVSITTVSRALSNQGAISEARKREIRIVAEEIGFQARASARMLRGSASRLLAFVASSLSNPFYAHLLEKIEDQCRKLDYQLLVANSWGSVANERDIVRSLLSRQVDGVFFVPTGFESSALGLCAATIPTVVVSHYHPAWPSIGVSHEYGGALVAEHLLEIGKKSCLLIGSADDPKLRGFCNFFYNKNITGFKTTSLAAEGFTEEMANQVRDTLLNTYDARTVLQFDSVFAQNDLAAIGSINALQALGISIPRQIAVCGFDDIPLAQEYYPPLTTVAQPLGQMAQAAMLLLSRLIAGESISAEERSIQVKPHLVVRGSSVAAILQAT